VAMIKLPENPPDLREREMLHYLCDAEHNPYHFSQMRQRVLAKCAEDTAWFINFAGYTFDPRPDVEDHDIKFILYEFQIDSVRWLDNRLNKAEDGIVEKSRDMGVTWITLAWSIHKWLFRQGCQILIGSRKEDLVDNWTLDSHFGKIEYYIGKLPMWMLPRGFSLNAHRMKLKLLNPENKNVIIGESANADFSRQGRYTIVLFDEAAFWPDLTSALRAAAQATRTRILVSTPNGYNTFARERFSVRYPVLTLHWSKHPKKDQAWYEREKKRMSAEDVAQELDISYHRSARGVVYPTFVNIPQGDFPYARGWSLFTSWDFGLADDTAIIWWAREPKTGMLRIIDAYKNNQKPIDFYVPFILGSLPENNEYDYTIEELVKIHNHSMYPRSINFGDPDVEKRGLATGQSAQSVLNEYGIVIFSNTKANNFRDRKSAVDLGIKNIEGINTKNSDECHEVVEHLTNARFPTRSPDSRSTAEITKPIHDQTEAYRSAVEYFFVNQPVVLADWERPTPQRKTMGYDSLH
jgi:hypothetical protein